MNTETIWKFETANFRVTYSIEPEYDLDLSWDEDGSVRESLNSGEFISFCAKVAVYDLTTGDEIGVDYLGSCIYRSAEEFMDHRECGKQNREYAAKGLAGRCGSYFRDMITQAIHEARKRQNTPRVPLRAVA